jgi:Na+/H+ antiporter NhaD/arsenite permease-like protein
VAISAGAVFFGGLTYIGNAPSLMIRTIAVERGERMPSFFGLVVYTTAMLLPCFVLVALVFLR